MSSSFKIADSSIGVTANAFSGIPITSDPPQDGQYLLFIDGKAQFTYTALGANGPTGFKGPDGDRGAQGDPGPDGDPGLKGPDGFQGIPGEQGQRGMQGQNGDMGPTGKDGLQGFQGARGGVGPPFIPVWIVKVDPNTTATGMYPVDASQDLVVGSQGSSGAGTRFQFLPSFGATRCGMPNTSTLWTDTDYGTNSFASGFACSASGNNSITCGESCTTDFGGTNGVAVGNGNFVGAANGFACNNSNQIVGDNSFVCGNNNLNSGFNSCICGFGNVINSTRDACVCLGSNSTIANNNTFVWSSGGATQTYSDANSWNVAANGSSTFFTNAASSIRVDLLANANAWSTPSDRAKKNILHELKGTDVLDILVRSVPLFTYEYDADESNGIRCIGPMAEDWYAAYDDVLEKDCANARRYVTESDVLGLALAALHGLDERIAIEG